MIVKEEHLLEDFREGMLVVAFQKTGGTKYSFKDFLERCPLAVAKVGGVRCVGDIEEVHIPDKKGIIFAFHPRDLIILDKEQR